MATMALVAQDCMIFWAAAPRGPPQLDQRNRQRPPHVTDVAAILASSAECLGRQVDFTYQQVLQRNVDAAGRAAWTAYLQSGHDLVDIQAHLYSSPEYTAKHGQGPATIQAWYQGILGRPAEAQGLDYWTAQLTAGTAIGDLIYTFMRGQEAANRTLLLEQQTPFWRASHPNPAWALGGQGPGF